MFRYKIISDTSENPWNDDEKWATGPFLVETPKGILEEEPTILIKQWMNCTWSKQDAVFSLKTDDFDHADIPMLTIYVINSKGEFYRLGLIIGKFIHGLESAILISCV